MRTPSPIGTLTMPERVYSLDILYPMMVVGTAERHVELVNLATNPTSIFKSNMSALKWQTREITCFPAMHGSGAGFALGSIEGRVCVQYFDEKEARYG